MEKLSFLPVMVALIIVLTSCSSQEKANEPVPKKEQRYENEAFKEVVVKEAGDNIVVKGKARVFEGVFQYAIMKGSTIIKQDFYQTDGAPALGDFEITIEKNLDATELELFEYSAKDGSKVHVLKIPLTKH